MCMRLLVLQVHLVGLGVEAGVGVRAGVSCVGSSGVVDDGVMHAWVGQHLM